MIFPNLKKHLDGSVVQRKTIQLRIEPSSVTSGSFCIDGKVSIDDNVFCVNSKKSHYLRVTSMPSDRNSFKVKLKTSGDQLISRAMVTCLPDSVATSLSSNLGSSSFRIGLQNLHFPGNSNVVRAILAPCRYSLFFNIAPI